MRPPPPDWPRLSVALFYEQPRRAIAWLDEAFGFAPRLVVDGADGAVVHSELAYGGAVVMVAGPASGRARPGQEWRAAFAAPGRLDGRTTASVTLYVDDVDAHCARARRAGARILSEPSDVDYGPDHWSDRSYAARDCGGHVWWFLQRLATKGDPAG